MKKILLVIIFLIAGCSKVYDEMHSHTIYHDGSLREYYIHVPENLNENIDLVVGLHGYTGTPESFIRTGDADFNNFLSSKKMIGVYPVGKSFYFKGRFFSSWNDLTGSIGEGPKGDICDIERDFYPYPPDCSEPHRCSWASCGDDIGFLEKVIDEVKSKYNIDNVFVAGMSNGGMIAQAVGCSIPDKVDGVINIAGMQSLGMSCVPYLPTSMVIYGSKKDTTVPPLEIVASDGYFYEPMPNTVDEWKNAFNCSKKEVEEINLPSRITKTHYSDCDDGVTITSLLDHENTHDWPKPYNWGLELLFSSLLN